MWLFGILKLSSPAMFTPSQAEESINGVEADSLFDYRTSSPHVRKKYTELLNRDSGMIMFR